MRLLLPEAPALGLQQPHTELTRGGQADTPDDQGTCQTSPLQAVVSITGPTGQ